MSYRNSSPSPVAALAVLITLVIGFIFVIVPGVVALFSFDKTDGGHVAVVRNGGPFDDSSIRQFIPVNSGLTYTGLYSSIHPYPAQARYYDIVPGGDDRVGVDAYRTPTKDGVDVGLTARINFTLNVDDPTLRRFDDAFGTRKFSGVDGEARYPWEGDEGFATWLDVVAKPIIQETLRQQVGNVDCTELIASCVLVRNTDPAVAAAAAVADGTNAETIQKIQKAINEGLAANINARLGGNYLAGIQFSLTGVDLDPVIRTRISAAQAEFARTSESQARLNQANLDAEANKARQLGYLVCPSCADIDKIHAQGDALSRIPSGVQVYAPGSGAQVAVGAR